MDGLGTAKGAQIFLKHSGADPVGQRVRELVPTKPQQRALQKIFGAVLDHGFGKRRRLYQEKPIIKNRRKLLRDVLIQQRGRHNIENDELRERFRVIKSQTMRRTAAPVM